MVSRPFPCLVFRVLVAKYLQDAQYHGCVMYMHISVLYALYLEISRPLHQMLRNDIDGIDVRIFVALSSRGGSMTVCLPIFNISRNRWFLSLHISVPVPCIHSMNETIFSDCWLQELYLWPFPITLRLDFAMWKYRTCTEIRRQRFLPCDMCLTLFAFPDYRTIILRR
ncbi:hypothetical protein I7I53_12026 [Histoplasma capsulatum var. duboisii H88]|uniref:Uncharacterized protein n=1 Tax=Ajellomyces capsulatus (strain H88) TaxID=544711 RepID=A0A8A1LX02_AJEC8|nr:hypothetical protein I7I53_12026 [Histoplasma capsulatum var. duboisii H88]